MQSPGVLPDNIKELINRKISHLRRRVEKRLIDVRLRVLGEQFRQRPLESGDGASGPVTLSAMDAYRGLIHELNAVADTWPETVAREVAALVETTGTKSSCASELALLVDAHAWPADGNSFLLALADVRAFVEADIQRGRHLGRGGDDLRTSAEARFRLVGAAAEAGIRNQGRTSREAAAILIEEYVLSHTASQVVNPRGAARTRDSEGQFSGESEGDRPYPCLPDLASRVVRIAFVGDRTDAGIGANNMLEITARGICRRIPMAAIDLVNRTTGAPNFQGSLLLGLTQRNSIPKTKENTQRMHRLRGVLRKHLGIVENPFEVHGTCWTPRFTVVDARGAADERARLAAERRTTSLDRDIPDEWEIDGHA